MYAHTIHDVYVCCIHMYVYQDTTCSICANKVVHAIFDSSCNLVSVTAYPMNVVHHEKRKRSAPITTMYDYLIPRFDAK